MKLASIEIVKNIRKHQNADKLELIDVLGWQVVSQKGVHQIGDKVVFIPIDAILPKIKWSEPFIDKNNPDKPIRVKNIKLRGEYSSGLVISLNEFPAQLAENTVVGEDLTSILGITKYIKEIPANLSGETEGDFPTEIISKTDEDNGLSNPELVAQVLSHDFLTITQKMDGSSITIIVENGKINKVCTRNLAKKDTGKSPFWEAAKKLNIPEGWTGAIQGELCGNGIQSNPIGLEGIEMFVYQIKQSHEYLNYEDMKNICENQFKCKVVPHIIRLEKKASVDIWDDPLSKLQKFADDQFYPNKKPAEGIVVRPSNYPRSFSSRRPLGFKLINRNYKD